MRHLRFRDVLELHRRLVQDSGGTDGILNLAALKSAVAQPHMTFAGTDLYTTVVEKAAALGHSIVANHAFLDGNKRTGHASMAVLLGLNGFELDATIDEQEDVVIGLACGCMSRETLTDWLKCHVRRGTGNASCLPSQRLDDIQRNRQTG